MIYYCDACRQTYELNRNDVRCIYCGLFTCRPYELVDNENE